MIEEIEFTVIELDPNEELIEELKILKIIKTMKKATIDFMNAINLNLVNNDDEIEQTLHISDKIVSQSKKTVDVIKVTAHDKIKSDMSIIKWISTAISFVITGPFGSLFVYLGLKTCQNKMEKICDEKINNIALL